MIKNYYYHNTIEQYTKLFGILFSNIKYSYNGTEKRVKIHTHDKNAWSIIESQNINRIASVTDGINMNTPLPVISFGLTGMTYDESRQTNATSEFANTKLAQETVHTVQNPVPYNLNFNLGIWTKHYDTHNQILEQILPFFQPKFNCKPKFKYSKDGEIIELNPLVKITLNSINLVTGNGFGEIRHIESGLNFTMEAYFYPPIINRHYIHTAVSNFYGDEELVDSFLTVTDQYVDSNDDGEFDTSINTKSSD